MLLSRVGSPLVRSPMNEASFRWLVGVLIRVANVSEVIALFFAPNLSQVALD